MCVSVICSICILSIFYEICVCVCVCMCVCVCVYWTYSLQQLPALDSAESKTSQLALGSNQSTINDINRTGQSRGSNHFNHCALYILSYVQDNQNTTEHKSKHIQAGAQHRLLTLYTFSFPFSWTWHVFIEPHFHPKLSSSLSLALLLLSSLSLSHPCRSLIPVFLSLSLLPCLLSLLLSCFYLFII